MALEAISVWLLHFLYVLCLSVYRGSTARFLIIKSKMRLETLQIDHEVLAAALRTNRGTLSPSSENSYILTLNLEDIHLCIYCYIGIHLSGSNLSQAVLTAAKSSDIASSTKSGPSQHSETPAAAKSLRTMLQVMLVIIIYIQFNTFNSLLLGHFFSIIRLAPADSILLRQSLKQMSMR